MKQENISNEDSKSDDLINYNIKQCDKVLRNIKEEPAVELFCVLPPFSSDKTLLGDFKEIKNKKANVTCEIDNDNASKSHTNQKKRVVCPVCSRTVLQRCLKPHLKTHETKSRERKFECEVCSKKFLTNVILTCHLKTHDMFYTCKLCDQKFKNRRSFEDHLKIHDDPEAFKCEICQGNFQEESQLRKHLLNEHVDKVYKCQHCPEKHKLKRDLVTNVVKKLCACK